MGLNYMPIVPIDMFDVLDMSGVKDVFILSQFWKNPEYREYYKSRTWDTIIVDNDLYEKEEAASFESMLEIAKELRANKVFIVGPEDLSSGINTAKLTQEIIRKYGCDGPLEYYTGRWQLMCILHERPNEMKLQYQILKEYDIAFGVSIFSFRLGFDRGALAKYVGIGSDKYIHAFGWDNLLEVYNLAQAGFNSVDSSLAVTAAVNRINLQDVWQITRDPGRDGVNCSTRAPIDGPLHYFQEIKHQALENIIFLRDWCRNKETPGRYPLDTVSVVNNASFHGLHPG